MVLIGMLDSPYVRRVAISMKLMGIAFEHRPISVFRTFEQFRALNPVVKAPSLICDDGAVLMDSTLILDYLESTVSAAKRLLPRDVPARRVRLAFRAVLQRGRGDCRELSCARGLFQARRASAGVHLHPARLNTGV